MCIYPIPDLTSYLLFPPPTAAALDNLAVFHHTLPAQRHAAEAALTSANGDVDRAAALILSWDDGEPPSHLAAPAGTADAAGAGSPVAPTLRIHSGASLGTSGGRSGMVGNEGAGDPAPLVPPLPEAGPAVPSR